MHAYIMHMQISLVFQSRAHLQYVYGDVHITGGEEATFSGQAYKVNYWGLGAENLRFNWYSGAFFSEKQKTVRTP